MSITKDDTLNFELCTLGCGDRNEYSEIEFTAAGMEIGGGVIRWDDIRAAEREIFGPTIAVNIKAP